MCVYKEDVCVHTYAYTHILCCLYPFSQQWMRRLFLYVGCCKLCCSKTWRWRYIFNLAFSFSLPSATSSCNSMLCCVWTQPLANNCVSPRRLSSQECAHLSQQGVGWGGGGRGLGRPQGKMATTSLHSEGCASGPRCLSLRLLRENKQKSLFQTQPRSPVLGGFCPAPWKQVSLCSPSSSSEPLVDLSEPCWFAKLDVWGACSSSAGLKSVRCSIWGSNPFLLREKFQVLT